MRKQYMSILKVVFYQNLISTRAALNWTQAQMAERLAMDDRSYIELDHGNSCCSVVHLLLRCFWCIAVMTPSFLSANSDWLLRRAQVMPHKKAIVIDYNEALSFRTPLEVSTIFITQDGYAFPICPRCNVTLEREYQHFCDRCGQLLDWQNFPTNVINAPSRPSTEKDSNTATPLLFYRKDKIIY